MLKPPISNLPKFKRKIHRGFSLIEVLAAISFFSVGLFAIANVFTYGLKISKLAQDNTLGISIAETKLEEILENDYDAIPTGIIEPKTKITSGSFGNVYNFYRETKVSYVNASLGEDSNDTGMKKIEVKIYWLTNVGKEQNITLMRLLSRH